jgi:hypothetical protein
LGLKLKMNVNESLTRFVNKSVQQDVDIKVCRVWLESMFNCMFYFCTLQVLAGDFVNGSKLI